MVVGVDPGSTSGLAILDLNSKPLFVGSIKGAGREVLVREIARFGEPVLISCDVSPTPGFITKIAAAFNAAIFTPTKSLSVDEKRSLVDDLSQLKEYDHRQLDPHSQDALAAAYKAFKRFRNKFEKIDETIQKVSSREAVEDVKAKIMHGYTVSRALHSIISAKELELEEKPKTAPLADHSFLLDELTRLRERIAKDETIISSLTKEVEAERELRRELAAKNMELTSALEAEKGKQAGDLRKDLLYKSQSQQISYLRARLQEAEAKIESLVTRPKTIQTLKKAGKAGDLILLKPIDTFTEEGVEKAIAEMDVKEGDPLIILNAAGGGAATAKRLVELKPRFVVTCTRMSHQAEESFENGGVALLDPSDLEVRSFEGIPAVSEEGAKRILDQKRRNRGAEFLDIT